VSDPDAPSDVDVVRRIYAALAERDIVTALSLFDPGCVVVQDDRLPWGGRFVGHEGVTEFAIALVTHIDSAVEIEAIFEADGDVIEVGRTRGTVAGTGTPFDVAEVHRWTIRDGLAAVAHFSIDTPAMLDALRA